MGAGTDEAVIGLEVHVQLGTDSKLFCSTPATFGAPPNTHVSPVSAGLPGALPVLNERAVTYAVQMALAGKNSVMPTIKRTSNKPYRWTVGEARLSRVANVEKIMPKSFITKDGFGITQRCRTYLEPLIAGEDYPPYGRDGMPKYVQLKNVAVPKKLKGFKL